MTVESLSTAEPTSAPAPAMMDTSSGPMSEDQAFDKVWDRLMVNNGADRADDGRFSSTDPAKAADKAPLEGGSEGEAPADTSTVAADVPLPPNWKGREELWGKLPADLKTDLAEFSNDLHVKSSDLGRKVAALEPLGGVGQEVANYLRQAAERSGGTYDGPQSPAEGVAYLFNIQRAMDADPSGTILQIMDTYGIRDQVAAMLGDKGFVEGFGERIFLHRPGHRLRRMGGLPHHHRRPDRRRSPGLESRCPLVSRAPLS